jgi:hypothetical protein
LFGRLRLFRRRRGRGFRWGRLLLNIDGHFPRQLDRRRRQIDDRERGRVKRDDDGDDKRAKPRGPDGRRLEDPPVEGRNGHGAGALGAGAGGAPGVGETTWRGPDTMAIREIPFAASSSITETTSP